VTPTPASQRRSTHADHEGFPDAACIGAAYQQRIDTINQELDAAMQDYCEKLGICG